MYYIVYQNVLKPGKSVDDVKRWLKQNWPQHQKWGAIEMEVYQPLYFSEAGILHVKYKLESLDKYVKGIRSREGEAMVKSLSEVIDVTRTTAQTMVEVTI